MIRIFRPAAQNNMNKNSGKALEIRDFSEHGV
jgi:hypothetical protein